MGWRDTLQRAWWTRRPGPLALALWPLSLLYGALAGLSRRAAHPEHVGVPVVVVGNLVVGGAGKTPAVIAIVELLRGAGWTPGVVSRGHGGRISGVAEVDAASSAADVGDEPVLIHARTRAPLVVGRDRVAAVQALRRAHAEVDIVVSDDGLQHRRLARDLQVLVFDARGMGNGLLLPAGPLRERLPDFVPAHSVVLYSSPTPSTPLPGFAATRRLAGVLSLADWRARLHPNPAGWAALRGRRIVAAAGIAQPERFFAQLREHGLDITPLPLPDHHRFAALPWPAESTDVIVTEKDAVKLVGRELGATRLWVAPLDFQPEPGFATAVLHHFQRPPTR